MTTDYWHSLDKETARRYELNPANIGISTPPFKDQLESLKTRIFQGASQVELGFTGRGKGSAGQGSITPEQISKEEREQIRLLAKINKVDLSTHNTVGVGSLSGFEERARAFEKENQEANLQELRRTIEFAADVAKGGPVVVHTGEFPRPIFKYRDEKFEGYPGEEKHAPVYLADPETGQVIPLRRDIKIYEPKWKDEKERIPELDPQTNEILFEAKPKTYEDLENEFKELKEKNPKEAEEKYRNDAGVYFYNKYAERELQQTKGEVDRLLEFSEDTIRRVQSYRDQLPPEEFKREMDKAEKHAKNYRNTAAQYARRAKEMEDQLDRIQPIQVVGVQRSADAIARGALFAMDAEKSRNLERPIFIAPENIFPENGFGSHPEELKELIQASRDKLQGMLWDKKTKSPTEQGREFGIDSQKDAEKASEDHIKATFDIGHLNTWKKYFKGSPEEFNEWVGNQIDSLQEKKMIGHAHVTDNFGFYDEHVTPGEGTAPIGGFLKKLGEAKERGDFTGKIIIEPGHQDVKAWTGALRAFNSPIYRVDSTSRSWTEVEHSYFSRTAAPSYMVGGVTPGATLSDEYNDWRFWSRLPIE